jgi:KaiC/GvpD/RAD55 family RecA-like ATPase
MGYYEELVKKIDKTMKAHPRRTVIMDAGTFKVLATGKDAAKLSRKLKRQRGRQASAVIFQQPDEEAVWILKFYSEP